MAPRGPVKTRWVLGVLQAGHVDTEHKNTRKLRKTVGLHKENERGSGSYNLVWVT